MLCRCQSTSECFLSSATAVRDFLLTQTSVLYTCNEDGRQLRNSFHSFLRKEILYPLARRQTGVNICWRENKLCKLPSTTLLQISFFLITQVNPDYTFSLIPWYDVQEGIVIKKQTMQNHHHISKFPARHKRTPWIPESAAWIKLNEQPDIINKCWQCADCWDRVWLLHRPKDLWEHSAEQPVRVRADEGHAGIHTGVSMDRLTLISHSTPPQCPAERCRTSPSLMNSFPEGKYGKDCWEDDKVAKDPWSGRCTLKDLILLSQYSWLWLFCAGPWCCSSSPACLNTHVGICKTQHFSVDFIFAKAFHHLRCVLREWAGGSSPSVDAVWHP